MSPALAIFPLAFSAMGCLCLAMEHHARQLGASSRIVQRRNSLRRAGWLLLALTTLVSVATGSWGFGLAALPGFLSAVTLPLIGLMAYRPRWIIFSTAVCAPIGLIVAGVLLLGPAVWPDG